MYTFPRQPGLSLVSFFLYLSMLRYWFCSWNLVTDLASSDLAINLLRWLLRRAHLPIQTELALKDDFCYVWEVCRLFL
jgi:hypothetical protein